MLMCTWYRAVRVDPPGAMLLKKTGSPLLSSHCLSVAPQLEVGLTSTYSLPPCCSVAWLALVQAVAIAALSSWVRWFCHVQKTPSSFGLPWPLALMAFPFPSLWCFLGLVGTFTWCPSMRVPFRSWWGSCGERKVRQLVAVHAPPGNRGVNAGVQETLWLLLHPGT